MRGFELSLGTGTRIIQDPNLTDSVEDWSRVRSPSRARRRLRRGFPQNMVVRQVPSRRAVSLDGGRTLVCHPEFLRELKRVLDKQVRDKLEMYEVGTLYGRSLFGGSK